MKKRFWQTDLCKILIALIELFLIGIAVTFLIFLYHECAIAEVAAGDGWAYRGYVICTPGDYVNVRSGPGKSACEIGRVEPGDMILLDGEEQNGYLHCVDLSFEMADGWIHSGFVVYDEPIRMDVEYTVVAKKRLYARKYIGGRKTGSLKPMTVVTVYYWTPEWSVTNRGYVRSEFLEYGGD